MLVYHLWVFRYSAEIKHFSTVIIYPLINYTCPPFSGPVSVLPYFQVLLFQSTRIQLSMLSNESSLVLWGTVYTSYDCAIAHTGYRINQIML